MSRGVVQEGKEGQRVGMHYTPAGSTLLRCRNEVRLLLKTTDWVLGSMYWSHKLLARSFTSRDFDSMSCNFLRYFSRRCLALLGLCAKGVHADRDTVTY